MRVVLDPGEADAWRVRQIKRIIMHARDTDRAMTYVHNITCLTDDEVGRHILNGTNAYRMEDIP